MKKIYSLLLFLFIVTNINAQEKIYLLLAYGQKSINMVCGEKLLIKQEEVSLLPAETIAYRSKVRTEIITGLGKNYNNVFVELIPANTAVILYEFEKTFTKQKDGWDCTNTQYGCVKGKDMLAAEKAFATQKAQYSKMEFDEVYRWGKPANATPAAIGENDLEVKWTTSSQKHLLQMTNTRKDVALEITVIQYKNGTTTTNGNETDLSKMIKTGETKITIEPGGRSQNSLDKSSAFEIRIIQKPPTKEELNWVDKTKQLIKKYIIKPDGIIEQKGTAFGVRG